MKGGGEGGISNDKMQECTFLYPDQISHIWNVKPVRRSHINIIF